MTVPGVLDDQALRRYRELLDAEDAAFDELEPRVRRGRSCPLRSRPRRLAQRLVPEDGLPADEGESTSPNPPPSELRQSTTGAPPGGGHGPSGSGPDQTGPSSRSATAARSDSSSSVVNLIRSAAKALWWSPATTCQFEPSLATGNPKTRPSGVPYSPWDTTARDAQPPGGRRRHDAAHRVDHGVGRRGRRRGAAGFDDPGAALLDGGDELSLEPFLVDDVGRRPAVDPGVLEVRELRRGMVAPDGHVGDRRHRCPRLAGQLAGGPVLIEPGHGEPALVGDVGRMGPGDQAVGVARVPDDEHPDVGRGVGADGLALRSEDAAVDA